MATFRLLKSGWRAEVYRNRIRRSKAPFRTKAEAVAWAGRIEAEIMAGQLGDIPNLTVSAILGRYSREVSSTKKGARWEKIRLALIGRDTIASVKLRSLSPSHVSDWQQRRLQEVSGASVRRERNLLSHAFELARKEWGLLKSNPFDNVRRPKDGKPKERVAKPEEIEQILSVVSPMMQRIITFALETGMRCSEIANLREGDIRGRVAILRDTKNGTSREVPLSEKALWAAAWKADTRREGEQQRAHAEWLAKAPSESRRGSPKPRSGSSAPPAHLFPLSPGSISTMFLRAAKQVGAEGLTFHCLRRTAATRISKRLDVWQLCSMFGWADPRIPLKHYYKADSAAIAERLD